MFLQTRPNIRVAKGAQAIPEIHIGPSKADVMRIAGTHFYWNLHPDERRPTEHGDDTDWRLLWLSCARPGHG